MTGPNSTAVAARGAGAVSSKTDRRTLRALSDDLCGVSDVGMVREHNEDLFHLFPDGKTMIVTDGMGGYEAGEVASALAIEAITLSASVAPSNVQTGGGDQESTPDAIERWMRDSLDAAQERIIKASAELVGGRQMGCTLILAHVDGNRLRTCHVGDVRCYVRTTEGLRQLTRDHSVVGALVQAGQLTADQARLHPSKNEVLQAIGIQGGIIPDVNSMTLDVGDRVLLCSDGLWEALPDVAIAEIVGADGSMRQLATQLADRANRAGGPDNVTVVLYEHASASEAVSTSATHRR